MDSFKQGAKDGVKIMIGLMPVFGLAAFFEGFITRLYNDISVFTTMIVALSVVFVIWYFIIYPIRLTRKLAMQLNEEEVINHSFKSFVIQIRAARLLLVIGFICFRVAGHAQQHNDDSDAMIVLCRN